mgnify:CR=1 FL=1
MHHHENVLAYPFDFSSWTKSAATSALTITESSVETPVGWGKAYSVEDASTSWVEISLDESTTYTHGDTWTASLFVRKQAGTPQSLLRVQFLGGAATSWINLHIVPSTGAVTTSAVVGVVDSSHVIAHDDDWWHIRKIGRAHV